MADESSAGDLGLIQIQTLEAVSCDSIGSNDGQRRKSSGVLDTGHAWNSWRIDGRPPPSSIPSTAAPAHYDKPFWMLTPTQARTQSISTYRGPASRQSVRPPPCQTSPAR